MKNKIRIQKILLLLLLFCSIGAGAQGLQEYLQIAAENNPELKSAYSTFEAAMQKAPQVSSLPDPVLTMSAFGRMIETRVGSQEARFSLMQMFPWFGTLDARKDAATLMAEAAFYRYIDQRNTIFLDVKSLYAELYALEKVIGLRQENLEILNSYRDLALSRFRSGRAPMVNVVKIDIQRDALATEIELLLESKKPLETRFNLMLNRDQREQIIIGDTLVSGQKLRNAEVSAENPAFEEHPTLRGLEKEKESYQTEGRLAQKEGFPMIGLGVDYSIISRRTDANPEMNGQDAIMPMLSVSLPIFRKKYKAAQKEAQIKEERVDYDKKAQQNELLNSYEMAVYELSKANKLVDLYDRQLKSADQANKLLISGFSNDIIDFEEILQMNEDILSYKTQKVEAVKNSFIAEAKLDYLFSKNEDYDDKN